MTARQLAETLSGIEKADVDYPARYILVLEALALAVESGYDAGIRIDPVDPTWPVVYIELPTGQVSWHMPEHKLPWDGHTTEDKYARIREFAEGVR